MPRLRPILLGLALGATCLPLTLHAHDWRQNRLLWPEKVTVGPSDNYQAQVNWSATQLVYTRQQNLVSQVVLQDLATGHYRPLHPEEMDMQDPAVSPNQQRLAVTSFHQNALGSICLLSMQQSVTPECITPPGQRARLAFWVDDHTLGYLLSPRDGEDQLVLHDLTQQTTQVIASGRLAAPTISEQGRYLLYQRRGSADAQGLYLYELASQTTHGPIQPDLPGISSYARLDEAEGYLYFSHFLSDTSGDQRIDAEDHSVIMRLSLEAALHQTRPLPQQLTSVAKNCNFPALSQDALYMTCAFEGSLDTYRLPRQGQIPAHWTSADLWQAYATASRYEHRLLLLNRLSHRTTDAPINMTTRLFSNHLHLGETSAAVFYALRLADALTQAGQNREAIFYRQLAQLIELNARFHNQPPGALTAHYRQALRLARTEFQAEQQTSLPLFEAWLLWLERRPEEALAHFSTLDFPADPLQIGLMMQLAEVLLSDQPAQLAEHWLQAAVQPQLPQNAAWYYAWRYLTQTARLAADVSEHQALLHPALEQHADSPVSALLQQEARLLALVASEDAETRRELFPEISAFLRASREDPQLQRIAHLRAIQITGHYAVFDWMEVMSRHWLTTTALTAVNFAEVAEQYAIINLGRAYGRWAQDDPQTALMGFYAVTRQTNDLEALHNLLRISQSDTLDGELRSRGERLYHQLIDEALIGNHDRYAQSLKTLLSHEPLTPSQLDRLIHELSGFRPQGLDTGMRDLLLGSLYHRRLLNQQQGYQYSSADFQRAHHHYMLALDLAHHNPRIQAPALHNLAQLHFSVRHYGLAAAFYAQRLQLPFVKPQQAVELEWHRARALFYANQPQAAVQAITSARAQAAALDLPLEQRLPLDERYAFYLLQAGHYQDAVPAYQSLLTHSLSTNNQLRARLSLAYAHYRLGEKQAATDLFEQLLSELPTATPRAAHNQQLASFEPRRLQVQVYGFMAQLTDDLTEKQHWLEQRANLLEQMRSRRNQYGWDENRRLEWLLQTRLQQAELAEMQDDLGAAHRYALQSLELAEAYWRSGASPASLPFLQTLYNYLTLSASHPEIFTLPPRLERLIQLADENLHHPRYTPPLNQANRIQLRLLQAWSDFQHGHLSESALRQLITEQLDAEQGWISQRPDRWVALQQLAAGLLQRLELLGKTPGTE